MDILNWCLAHWREVLGCIILVGGVLFVAATTRKAGMQIQRNDRRKR